jgi:hypothetical protein
VKARSARGAYQGSLRDRDGRLGGTLYQEQLLLPGAAADMMRAAEEFERARAEKADDAVDPARSDAEERHPAGR